MQQYLSEFQYDFLNWRINNRKQQEQRFLIMFRYCWTIHLLQVLLSIVLFFIILFK